MLGSNQNIRHQTDWSKVSLYPSPSFLSNNKLAKENTECVAPVIIPSSYAQLEPYATIWIGPQTLGRTKSGSLYPLRKALTKLVGAGNKFTGKQPMGPADVPLRPLMFL